VSHSHNFRLTSCFQHQQVEPRVGTSSTMLDHAPRHPCRTRQAFEHANPLRSSSAPRDELAVPVVPAAAVGAVQQWCHNNRLFSISSWFCLLCPPSSPARFHGALPDTLWCPIQHGHQRFAVDAWSRQQGRLRTTLQDLDNFSIVHTDIKQHGTSLGGCLRLAIIPLLIAYCAFVLSEYVDTPNVVNSSVRLASAADSYYIEVRVKLRPHWGTGVCQRVCVSMWEANGRGPTPCVSSFCVTVS
jgi:hypothetical protein